MGFPRCLPFLLLASLACEPSVPPAPARAEPTAAPSAHAGTNALAGEIVAAHNRARAAVEPPAKPPLPSLVWSEALAAVARRWAEQCRFEHNPDLKDQRLGENLAAFSDATGSVGKTVGNWVAEAADYDLETNRCKRGAVCGHYTQVVWRDTREVGCAVALCQRNSPFPRFPRWQLWVCNYSPPGNWVGERPYSP